MKNWTRVPIHVQVQVLLHVAVQSFIELSWKIWDSKLRDGHFVCMDGVWVSNKLCWIHWALSASKTIIFYDGHMVPLTPPSHEVQPKYCMSSWQSWVTRYLLLILATDTADSSFASLYYSKSIQSVSTMCSTVVVACRVLNTYKIQIRCIARSCPQTVIWSFPLYKNLVLGKHCHWFHVMVPELTCRQ